jgi:hypothetical protein
MNPVVLPMLSAVCAERVIEPGVRPCDVRQCFVSVSWLAQQVFYLPCSATVVTRPLNGPRLHAR